MITLSQAGASLTTAMVSDSYYDLYYTYKFKENDAFSSLFPGQKWQVWTLKRLYNETASVAPSLVKEQRQPIISSFKVSSKARKDLSLLFRYAPLQSRLRHEKFVDLLVILIDLLKTEALPEAEMPKDAVLQQVEALEHVSVNEVTFLRFLEDIEMLVGQALALWPRVEAGELRLSTASKRMYCLPLVETSHKSISLPILTYSSDKHVSAQNHIYSRR